MGRPLRSGAQSSFSVAIRPQVKTCPEEVGIYTLGLENGTRIVVIGHTYWPSHDHNLVETLKKFLAASRPDVIVFLGGAIHEEAFKAVVDDNDLTTKLIGADVPKELDEVMKAHEGMEERFLELARRGGKFIAEFAEISGAHMYYIPSATGSMPNEIDIQRFVLEQKERADAWADRHPDEAKKGPPIPLSFGEFLGLDKHPQVTVLPFGSALMVNEDTMFKIGDFKRRHPGSAAKVDWEQSSMNIIRSHPGMVSSAWQTTPVHTLPSTLRDFWQFHEVGNLFSIRKQLGYLRTYDRRCKGFWVGQYEGGKLFGWSIPFQPGKDGRRCFVIDGEGYVEETVSPSSKIVELPSPKRNTKPLAQASIQPVAEPARKARKTPVKARKSASKAKKPAKSRKK